MLFTIKLFHVYMTRLTALLHIITYFMVVTNNNGFWVGLLDLLAPFTVNLYLTSNTALSLIHVYTI
jgi:hypothetical protein